MTSLPALREAVAKEDQQMPSEIAIATAAQCWCDPRTETREMDVELATVFAERVDAWIETARQHAHNEEYYRGLLDRIGERVGPSAYVSDDGSVQDSVLRAKVPDLVSALLDEVEALRAVLETGEPLGGYSTDQRIDIQVDRAAWQAWQARRKP